MMKNKAIALFGFLTLAGYLSAQTKDPVVLEIGDKKVYKSEFEYIYNKNNFLNEENREPIDEYLDRFVNFKLKVVEAENIGLDTATAFEDELMQYRGQLSRNYMVDSATVSQLVHEAYERMKWEVKASHILVKVDLQASPGDTLKAWNKITALRKKVLESGDFEAVAASPEGSEDESAVDNKGNLGYFTVFRMVYPFESAAYNTPVGEVSQPIRTRFGYHLIKVYDKRPARGKIQVAHIMLGNQSGDNAEEIKKKAFEIYELAKKGEDFGQLASQFSEDQSSARNAGLMNWFGVGEYVDEFLDQCFALKDSGSISEPFMTEFGWHIVKKIGHKPILSFEKEKPAIEAKIQRDNRSLVVRSSFVEGLRKEYKYRVHTKGMEEAFRQVDTNIFHANWRYKGKKPMDKPIFTFGDTTFTQRQFLDYLEKYQIPRGKYDLNAFLKDQLDTYSGNEMTLYERARLEEKYPRFKLTMQEYRDGLLLFELMDKEVWSRASKDTVGLVAFYEQNKNRFMWPERADVTIYTCADAKTAKKAYKLAKKGKLSNEEIEQQLNATSSLAIKIESGIKIKKDTPVLTAINWAEGLNKPVAHNGGFVFVNLKKSLPPTPKTLDEARGPVIAAYQEYLEKQWVASLKSKYAVKIHREALNTIE